MTPQNLKSVMADVLLRATEMIRQKDEALYTLAGYNFCNNLFALYREGKYRNMFTVDIAKNVKAVVTADIHLRTLPVRKENIQHMAEIALAGMFWKRRYLLGYDVHDRTYQLNLALGVDKELEEAVEHNGLAETIEKIKQFSGVPEKRSTTLL